MVCVLRFILGNAFLLYLYFIYYLYIIVLYYMLSYISYFPDRKRGFLEKQFLDELLLFLILLYVMVEQGLSHNVLSF